MAKTNLWEAEKFALSKITTTFLPRRMLVKDAEGNEIGYTNPERGIFIAKEHNVFSMLSEDEKRFFRKGVFAHELLHQIFSDFDELKRMMLTYSPAEREIFALFSNVLEDPAIEYWAKTKFGGSLLKSLKFSIAHIYEQSPSISEAPNAFAQLVNALIQMGDMGIVKGSFTFPEAKEIFFKVAPMFNSGILEPNGKKRLKIARTIMEMSRPLWEEMAKEREELQKRISDLMRGAGKDMMSGSGSGEDGDPDFAPEEGDKEKRRSSTLSNMKKESSAESGDDTSSSSSLSSSETGEEDASSSGSSSSSSADSSSSSSSDTREGKGKEKASGESKSSSESGGDDFSSSSSPSSSSSSSKSKKEEKEEGEGEGEGENIASAISKDKELSKEDKEEMKKELEEAREEIKEKEKEDDRDKTDLLAEALKCGSRMISTYDICNVRASAGSPEGYSRIVEGMTAGISNTTRQLRRMLTIAQEDTEYAIRGRINVNRLNSGKNTPRVFDRKKVPNEIADMVVGVAVDLSGSMGGQRIEAAKKCCIALAEVCNNLNIPIYIMGYTGDVGRYTIVHRHFVTWKNSRKDRESLCNIAAEAQNYDGPSFRYISDIMKKKRAKHKLLIVVSDGTPYAPTYRGESAYKDTANAIRDAKKNFEVLGVAIGNDSTEILHSFYGNDFMHVATPSDLFSQLSIKLKKFVKKWIDEE